MIFTVIIVIVTIASVVAAFGWDGIDYEDMPDWHKPLCQSFQSR